jgi:mycothiol system anti-sigma-R factor
MSCGDPHEIDCLEVLEEVYTFLDGELNEARRVVVQQHIEECSPCLRQFGLEQMVKRLVARSCGAEQAPDALRMQVVARIRQITVSYESYERRPD